ncbi:hypothetical protein JOM56_005783 [Amanita muscaria]
MSLSPRLNVTWSRYLAPVRFFGRLVKPPEPTTGEVEEQGVGVRTFILTSYHHLPLLAMPTIPVVRASPVSSGRYSGLTVDPLDDITTPSSPAVSTNAKSDNSVENPLSYARRCLTDVFTKKLPDYHRAQALYQVFIEIASELETSSQFNALMTRIADNLESLGCKKKPSNQNKWTLINSSSAKQMKRKRFKSSKKRKYIDTENTSALLTACYGSEPEMDLDGFFPNPIYGLKEILDDFEHEDSDVDSFLLDQEDRAIDRELEAYGNPELLGFPSSSNVHISSKISLAIPSTSALPPPSLSPDSRVPNVSLLRANSTLPPPSLSSASQVPNGSLPRANTEPPRPNHVKTTLPLRAQTAPPTVSRNTLTAQRCTTKDASPSSFVKFMDVPVTMTREHIHDCLKDNRKWSMVDISNMEIFAIKNKDSTIINVLKIKFRDDAQSNTAKRLLTTTHKNKASNIVQTTAQTSYKQQQTLKHRPRQQRQNIRINIDLPPPMLLSITVSFYIVFDYNEAGNIPEPLDGSFPFLGLGHQEEHPDSYVMDVGSTVVVNSNARRPFGEQSLILDVRFF